MLEPQHYISMASVALAALMALFGGFRYVTAQVEGLRREIGAAEEKSRLLVEKQAESMSKQVHQYANSAQTVSATLQTELRALQQTAVRHEQMDALESRLNTSLSKIEVKVDRLAETAGEIVAIKVQLQTTNSQLERLITRLENAGHNSRI